MNNDSRKKLEDILIHHEGYRQFVYNDLTGDTVHSPNGKYTVGIGTNLESDGISLNAARFILNEKIDRIIIDLQNNFPVFKQLDDIRKAVLIDMTYNLGHDGLFKFKQTLSLISKGDFGEAAKEMLKSKWANQVGKRAIELSKMMATGKWLEL